MEPENVKMLIQAGFSQAEIEVTGDGSHFQAIVVSPDFTDKTTIKRHQLVYATLGDKVQNNEIHALSLKTYTPDEWDKARKLRIS